MNYLTRDERREVILKAAMQVALSGGFTAMTVRHIATIAGVASDDGRLEPYIRLWREAQLLADSDADIKGAYLLTMDMWHKETVALILQGTEANEFRPIDNADNIAWRLIALVCGLDGIYALGMNEINDETFTRYIQHYITIELNPA